MKIALCLSGYVGYFSQFKVGSLDSQPSKPLPIEIGHESLEKYFIQDKDGFVSQQSLGEEMRAEHTHKVIEALQGDVKPVKFKITEDFNV